jgi:hypothetical protein
VSIANETFEKRPNSFLEKRLRMRTSSKPQSNSSPTGLTAERFTGARLVGRSRNKASPAGMQGISMNLEGGFDEF